VTAPKPLVFDGHNDLLSKIFNEGGITRVASFFEGREGAIDLKKAEVGGFGGGFFAVYVPSKFDLEFSYQEMEKASYRLPLPDPIEWSEAVAVVATQVTILRELERLGGLTICHSVSDIRSALKRKKLLQFFILKALRRLIQIFICWKSYILLACAPLDQFGAVPRFLERECHLAFHQRQILVQGSQS